MRQITNELVVFGEKSMSTVPLWMLSPQMKNARMKTERLLSRICEGCLTVSLIGHVVGEGKVSMMGYLGETVLLRYSSLHARCTNGPVMFWHRGPTACPCPNGRRLGDRHPAINNLQANPYHSRDDRRSDSPPTSRLQLQSRPAFAPVYR